MSSTDCGIKCDSFDIAIKKTFLSSIHTIYDEYKE